MLPNETKYSNSKVRFSMFHLSPVLLTSLHFVFFSTTLKIYTLLQCFQLVATSQLSF